jgi:hypothetical protein
VGVGILVTRNASLIHLHGPQDQAADSTVEVVAKCGSGVHAMADRSGRAKG